MWTELSAEIPVFAAGFLVAGGTTPLLVSMSSRLRLQDEPSDRKVHRAATPNTGGVAIMMGVAAAMLLGGSSGLPSAVLLCAAVIGVLGFVDDRRHLNEHLRLVVQAVVAIAVWSAGVRLEVTGLYMLDFAFSMLWIVGMTNAFNFMDNMDGLSSGVGVIGSTALAICALATGQTALAVIALGIAGACAGFLLHNFAPARIFMGDAGSLPIGFLLAVVGAQIEIPGATAFVSASLPVMILGIFVLDTTTMAVGRVLRREPLIGGRMDHVSHRLLGAGLNVRSVAVCLYTGAAVYAVAGGLLLVGPDPLRFALLGGTVVVSALLLLGLMHLTPPVRLAPSTPAESPAIDLRQPEIVWLNPAARRLGAVDLADVAASD